MRFPSATRRTTPEVTLLSLRSGWSSDHCGVGVCLPPLARLLAGRGTDAHLDRLAADGIVGRGAELAARPQRENRRLKRIVADQALNLQVLKDVLGNRSWRPGSGAGSSGKSKRRASEARGEIREVHRELIYAGSGTVDEAGLVARCRAPIVMSHFRRLKCPTCDRGPGQRA